MSASGDPELGAAEEPTVIGLQARQMTPFPQRQSSPGAFLVPGPRAVMAACGEFHDPTMILRYRPLNQPMSRLQTPGGDTVRRGSDISRLPVAGQDRTEPAERLCEQSVTFPSLLHQAQTAMSPIMSRRRAESSLEISRQLGPRPRLLQPAPRRAPDGRLEGEQCPYCHYPDSNTCTILSACTVPPDRTRPGSDPQAGASSGHSATSPPTMRGRRPAVAGMPSPARTRYAPTLSRSRRPAAPMPSRPRPGCHRPPAVLRQRGGTGTGQMRPAPRSPTPDPPRATFVTGAHEGQCNEDPSSQDHDAPAAGGQAPDHLVDSHDRPYRDDDRQRGLPCTPGDRCLLAGAGRPVRLCASRPQAPAAVASCTSPGQPRPVQHGPATAGSASPADMVAWLKGSPCNADTFLTSRGVRFR